MPQDCTLLAGSVAGNLRLARPDAGMDALRAAARAAGIDEHIQGLPQGYATPVGEGGGRLSGGQRQRLALAPIAEVAQAARRLGDVRAAAQRVLAILRQPARVRDAGRAEMPAVADV
ncbi:hypothetical protein ACX12L_20625 [Alicycliphilus sp. T452]